MQKYFIQENNKTSESLTLEDLKKKYITEDTWVWREGLSDWVQAKELPELHSLYQNRLIDENTVRKPNEWSDLKIYLVSLSVAVTLIILLVIVAVNNNVNTDSLDYNINYQLEDTKELNEKTSNTQDGTSQNPYVEKTEYVNNSSDGYIYKNDDRPLENFIEENKADKNKDALEGFIDEYGGGNKPKPSGKPKPGQGSFFNNFKNQTIQSHQKAFTPKSTGLVGPSEVSYR